MRQSVLFDSNDGDSKTSYSGYTGGSPKKRKNRVVKGSNQMETHDNIIRGDDY